MDLSGNWRPPLVRGIARREDVKGSSLGCRLHDSTNRTARRSALGHHGDVADYCVRNTLASSPPRANLNNSIHQISPSVNGIPRLAGKKSLWLEPGEKEPLPYFPQRYRGLTPGEILLDVDGGKVEAITGART